MLTAIQLRCLRHDLQTSVGVIQRQLADRGRAAVRFSELADVGPNVRHTFMAGRDCSYQQFPTASCGEYLQSSPILVDGRASGAGSNQGLDEPGGLALEESTSDRLKRPSRNESYMNKECFQSRNGSKIPHTCAKPSN